MGLEPRDCLVIEVAHIGTQVAFAWRQRRKEHGVVCGFLKGDLRRQCDLRKPHAWRQHTDDSGWISADMKGLSNHRGLARKEFLPAFVTQHDHVVVTLPGIAVDKAAAQHGLHSQQMEKIRRSYDGSLDAGM